VLPKSHADAKFEQYFVSSRMYDLQKEGDGVTVALLVVLLECLWDLHASTCEYTGEGFEGVFGEDWEER
jgi:hypothetical protein